MHEVLEATVILKSRHDLGSYKGEIAANHAQLGDFLPDLDTIVQSARFFRNAGFRVLPSQNCIRISGTTGQFQSMFGVYFQPGAASTSIGSIQVPDLLEGVLVRLLFQGEWAQVS